MFNLSNRMEEKVKDLIEEMEKTGTEFQEVPDAKDFYVTTTERNKEDVLLGKEEREEKTFFLYQKNP